MGGGVTATSYTLGNVGGTGYFNPGGWNTTLTDTTATAAEVCGIKRYDGAGVYIYAYRRTSSAQPGAFQIRATNTQDPQGILPVITFTNNTTGGTACQWIVMGMAVTTTPSNTYAWYMQEGYGFVQNTTDTAVLVSGQLFCVSVASGNAIHQTAAFKNAQGWVLSDIATMSLGPAFVKFSGL